jgi:hypothetical protein
MLWAQSNYPSSRVALVSIDDGEATRDVLALTEAELSKDQSVVLADRAGIERILQEQQMARGGSSLRISGGSPSFLFIGGRFAPFLLPPIQAATDLQNPCKDAVPILLYRKERP